ncbi:MAG: hypothetical protein JW909_13690 [Planctomycetes bacterium]|nr:hypothetical protein [Planctomycetota bacterium]
MNFTEFLYNLGKWVESAGTSHPWLVPLLALVAGMMAALSPCSLAALPLMMGYILGGSEKSWKRALLLSVVFVAGLSIVFTAIGLLSAVFDPSYLGRKVVGVILLVVAVWLSGFLNIPVPMPNLAGFRHRGVLGAFLLGVVFAFSTGPCAGPLLVVMMTLTENSTPYRGMIFFLFSMGTGILIVVGGLSAGLLRKLVSSRGLSRVNTVFKFAGGSTIALIGLYLLLQPYSLSGLVAAVVSVAVLAALAALPRVLRRRKDASTPSA